MFPVRCPREAGFEIVIPQLIPFRTIQRLCGPRILGSDLRPVFSEFFIVSSHFLLGVLYQQLELDEYMSEDWIYGHLSERNKIMWK